MAKRNSGMHLAAFYASAAKSGLTQVVPLADEAYTIDSTNYMKYDDAVKVIGFWNRTAAIANFVQGGLNTAPQRGGNPDISIVGTDQTSALLDQQMVPVCIDLPPSKKLGYQADNGNNAQVEAGLVLIGIGGKGKLIEAREVLAKYGGSGKLRTATGAGGTALTGGAWTASAITWGFDFDDEKEYQVLGMAYQAATGYAGRLILPGSNYEVGVPAGDTKAVARHWFFEDGPIFSGSTPPTQLRGLSSGNDAAQAISLILLEV